MGGWSRVCGTADVTCPQQGCGEVLAVAGGLPGAPRSGGWGVQGGVPMGLPGFRADGALLRGAACWTAVYVGGVCRAAPGASPMQEHMIRRTVIET